eukprot:TRINITY_DN3040_c0_g2_i1.p1 TRINITY_DN3040_c0_g2~~TRINITY_DN3040_c0_g2_i1.p1  ORF type:complete len:743 (-),score=324.90 TRINITY_DN3040_c0_g2_i1:111-2339(-)
MAVEGPVITALILICVFVGFLVAIYYSWQTAQITLAPDSRYSRDESMNQPLQSGREEEHENLDRSMEEIARITAAIAEGANAFLHREYVYLAAFMGAFAIVILIVIGLASSWSSGVFSMIAFLLGASTSVLSGYIGMKIAVFANGRTAKSAVKGIGPAFLTAFKAGTVMGFALVSLGILILYITISLFRVHFDQALSNANETAEMYECVAGYGLGGSSVALFGRVGGGIYTKAADVGADLVGKVEKNIPEDDPRNPAVIADNVGDNVGDIAGMGADLFGSFAESTCAAMVVSAQARDLFNRWDAMCFPIMITALGILVCLLTTFFSTHLFVVKTKADVEPSLKRQLIVSTVLMTPVLYLLTSQFLPSSFYLTADHTNVKNWHVFFCVACGLWSGLIIGFTTEYYTSHAYQPVREVAESCRTGAATNIIFGLALGYKSVIIPIVCLSVTIYIGFSLAGMYGIAVAALGILSTLPVGLTIDAYGPISDNAGGIAEMAEMGEHIREHTDALDAAGNTTAAIGKGFAIGSAALVSLALFGAFVSTRGLGAVDILQPFQFAGLLFGAMLPYWFTAMTMKSVGSAAYDMVNEVRRQFREIPGLMSRQAKPDYRACVSIATDAALREMLAPGAMVIFTPIIVGFFFGTEALAGVLAGALVSGVQIAISSSNTGGAWDNAKKYVESGAFGKDNAKGSDLHKAAVIGDTVGDPLKDTSGPSLNILIKLMAIISLVFARSFPSTGYIVQIFK